MAIVGVKWLRPTLEYQPMYYFTHPDLKLCNCRRHLYDTFQRSWYLV